MCYPQPGSASGLSPLPHHLTTTPITTTTCSICSLALPSLTRPTASLCLSIQLWPPSPQPLSPPTPAQYAASLSRPRLGLRPHFVSPYNYDLPLHYPSHHHHLLNLQHHSSLLDWICGLTSSPSNNSLPTLLFSAPPPAQPTTSLLILDSI